MRAIRYQQKLVGFLFVVLGFISLSLLKPAIVFWVGVGVFGLIILSLIWYLAGKPQMPESILAFFFFVSAGMLLLTLVLADKGLSNSFGKTLWSLVITLSPVLFLRVARQFNFFPSLK